MAIRTATGPNGEKLTFRSATNEAGETQWFQVETPQQESQPAFQPDIQQPTTVPAEVKPYGFDPSAVAQRNRNIQAKNEYEKSFIGDQERQKIKAEEAQRGFFSGVGEGIKHIGKEFYAGTLQSPDFLPEPLQDILDYRIGGDNTLSREEQAKQIDDAMAAEEERYKITRGENPLSTTVGEMIPFLATGAVGERALVNLGGKVLPKLNQASIATNRALGATTEANRLANLAKRFPSEYEKTINSIARGGITGAAEGAAQHDQDSLEGAITALVGGSLSHVGILKPLQKVNNERDAAGKKIINEMYENGFIITPGVRSGNRQLQTAEAGLRNSDIFSQEMFNRVDRRNQARITDMAGEAIGLNTKNRDMLSQEELANHMTNLSNQYKQLEANTQGKFSQDSFKRINNLLKNMQPIKDRNQSALSRQNYAIMKDAIAEMRTVLQPFTTRDGKFAQQRFDGARYQDASQYLNDQINSAYHNGNKILANNLKAVKQELDKSIENGMGKADAKQWRDLNERYAMTSMLLKNGVTPSGVVDPSGITNAVMSNDEAIRTLTGKGGRIRKFQDIARYNDILKNTEGGSLTGLGSSEPNAQRGMMTRAADLLPTPVQHFRLGYKTNTITTPFIGKYISPIHGLLPETITNIGRSYSQTNSPKDLYEHYFGDKEQ